MRKVHPVTEVPPFLYLTGNRRGSRCTATEVVHISGTAKYLFSCSHCPGIQMLLKFFLSRAGILIHNPAHWPFPSTMPVFKRYRDCLVLSDLNNCLLFAPTRFPSWDQCSKNSEQNLFKNLFSVCWEGVREQFMKVQKSAKQSDLAFSTDDCWLGFLIISRNLMFHNVSKDFRVQFHQNGGEFLAVAPPIPTNISGSDFGTSNSMSSCFLVKIHENSSRLPVAPALCWGEKGYECLANWGMAVIGDVFSFLPNLNATSLTNLKVQNYTNETMFK